METLPMMMMMMMMKDGSRLILELGLLVYPTTTLPFLQIAGISTFYNFLFTFFFFLFY